MLPFFIEKISEKDGSFIDELFLDASRLDLSPETELEAKSNAEKIKGITQEVRAIRKQGVVLIGERIAAAKAVFDSYGERKFMAWLTFTFGSYKSGYNYLSYFNLHEALSPILQSRLKAMPVSAAYMLASSQADIQRKSDLIEHHSTGSYREIVTIIQETLGDPEKTKSARRTSIERDIRSFQEKTARWDDLDERQNGYIRELINVLLSKLQTKKFIPPP